MTSSFVFVDVEEVVRVHALVMGVQRERASTNVMNPGLLESALTRPRQLYFYEGVDLPALAATLLWGVVQNHAFYDGNKRTAWLATQLFLYRNGYELPDNHHSTRLVLNVALGRRSVDQVEDWIRDRLQPAQQLWLFE